jgi:hypothetical protein
MRAHKLKVTIPADHEVRFRMPADFPAGEAEVIVLAERKASLSQTATLRAEATDPLARLRAKYPAAGSLGPALLEEDPAAPMDAESWPAELKP